jgi:dihydrofolate reductase
MLNGQKIIFVSIVDNKSMMMPGLKSRIWHHQKLVDRFLRTSVCLIGRRTFDITNWKGKRSWVLTKDRNWRRSGIGTIHHIDDLHLFSKGPIYVLGGISLFKQLQSYVDEIHLYVLNEREGTEPWITIDMNDWKPQSYFNRGLWSYAHLIHKKDFDIFGINEDLFNFNL